MAGHTWTRETAAERIDAYLAEVDSVTIKPYVRDTDLASLPRDTAYRVDGAHVYIDILNLEEMLASTAQEGVTCHRRALRFLNLHYRAVRRIVEHVDAIEVDFHNQRLHAVVTKPYGDEAKRVHRAVALAQLVIDVLGEIGEESGDDIIPPARVRAGIDTGIALAVNNGRRGHQEPVVVATHTEQALPERRDRCGGDAEHLRHAIDDDRLIAGNGGGGAHSDRPRLASARSNTIRATPMMITATAPVMRRIPRYHNGPLSGSRGMPSTSDVP